MNIQSVTDIQPGQSYRVNDGPEVIVVRSQSLSETPRSGGACHTLDGPYGPGITPAGWFVYFSYPGGSTDRADHRGFFAFGSLTAA